MNTRPDPKRHTGGVVLQDAGASPSTAAVAGTIVSAESCDPALQHDRMDPHWSKEERQLVVTEFTRLKAATARPRRKPL